MSRDVSPDPTIKQVKQVAARYGWDTGARWAAIKDRVQRESSWNPRTEHESERAALLAEARGHLDGRA